MLLGVVILSVTYVFLSTFTLLLTFAVYVRYLRCKNSKRDRLVVAFFHPYCCSGGGGERVLWSSIEALRCHSHVKCCVYTGDCQFSPPDIRALVKQRFGISLSPSVEFVYLKHRWLLDPNLYPRFTLLCQSIGSLLVAVEALFKLQPDVFIETTGFAFTLNLFRTIGGSKTACYIHYPTISVDMLQLVAQCRPMYNNDAVVATCRTLSTIKLIYYTLFARLYGWMGHYGAQVIMVNSTWTKDHIVQLWKSAQRTHLVFPPCDVTHLEALPLSDRSPLHDAPIYIVAVGQFRPEKDYQLTLRSFQRLLQKCSDSSLSHRLRMVLVGGVRDESDESLLKQLQHLSAKLNIRDQVEWRVNVSYEQLISTLAKGTVGIHTMWNEHFGIGVVEMMAAGVIVVAHNSGGPKLDIVHPVGDVGFLASTEDEYADAILNILHMPIDDRLRIQQAARRTAQRFSVDRFHQQFLQAVQPLVL